MTLAQLRAFLLTASHGSFTAAARELKVAQASVSELVRRLEGELGVDLFVLVKGRLALTSAANELHPRAQAIVRMADETGSFIRALLALEAGTASFGLLKYSAAYSLSDLAEQFHAAHPNVRIRLLGQNSLEVAADVRAGVLEAGLVVLPIDPDGLDITPIIRDEVFFATADHVRLPDRVDAEFLANAQLILYDTHHGQDPTRRQLTERAENLGLRLSSIMELEDAESALNLVSRGVGDSYLCGAIAKSAVKPANVVTASFHPPLFDTIALIKRADSILSPATQEMADLARRILLQHARRFGAEAIA